MTSARDALLDRWTTTVAGVAGDAPAQLQLRVGRSLLAAYGDPRRGYHDLTHLSEVLQRADELGAAAGGPGAAVRLALWFHDAVYLGRGEDEELSARLAERDLTLLAVPAALAGEVARLVRLTASHAPAPDDANGAVVCDADLAVLASPPQRYAAYLAGVRRDYAHVDDAAFAAGRAAVLRQLLDRPRLFHTEVGRARWEAPARANLRAELAVSPPQWRIGDE